MTYCNLDTADAASPGGEGQKRKGLGFVIRSALQVLTNPPYNSLSFQVRDVYLFFFFAIKPKFSMIFFLLLSNYQVSYSSVKVKFIFLRENR